MPCQWAHNDADSDGDNTGDDNADDDNADDDNADDDNADDDNAEDDNDDYYFGDIFKLRGSCKNINRVTMSLPPFCQV